ncbi:34a7413f-76c0-498e-bef9-158266d19e0a [Sclerotinia trifoliorum]|uniref:DNA-directed RNA polymerase III subunit RPC9 n=1 Tax=Sclerotinia trifoliorum TaxID=28548 RepID=A0A8H2VP80_9HELO|nr:34a7413f-76c0-498e-bef9-158266d19e0a [Sclerotinia trifoliorum]
MKILEAQSATLTNFEVYTHLKDIQTKHRTGGRRPGNLDNVMKELIQYLEEAPSPLAQKPCPYKEDTIRNLLEQLRPYDLTKAEILMIINHRPTSMENLNIIIEELELRFPDENEQWAIIDIVKEVLGAQDAEEMKQAMADNTEMAKKDEQKRQEDEKRRYDSMLMDE